MVEYSNALVLDNSIIQASDEVVDSPLSFSINTDSSLTGQAFVFVAPVVTQALYNVAAASMQKTVQTRGFNRGNVPLSYIKENFRDHLTEHIKEFLLKFCAISYLQEQIRTHKILIAGDPRLVEISVDPERQSFFRFELTLFTPIPFYEWRYLPFKAPKRKNYKDLDKQVESFILEEKRCQTENSHEELVPGDWVNFDIALSDPKESTLLPHLQQNFWFRIGEEEIESPLREIFISKKIGQKFFTNNKDLQNFFSAQTDIDHYFQITVNDILPHSYFCLEHFKKHFRIKTNKEMHQKLIEVFSYRNDISQRRMMVEEAFKLLLSKSRLTIPNYLVLRQQKMLIEQLQHNPDYQVYRMQKDFQDHIRQLAEKREREAIFIDQLSYHENMLATHTDIKSYLNLMGRPRMKEFIYFEMPSFKIQGQEIPIAAEDLRQICIREKTINYVIHHLAKN